jgi:2-keto-4-pentenoate hydratase/2-oxohepta-3-ene-1,7-dioic acid hydratase in catechol pathway
MRTVRINTRSGPQFGVIDGQEIELLDGAPFAGDASRTGERVPLDEDRLLAPITPTTIFAVGRNYAEHAKEMGLELGADPTVFMKPVSSLLDPGGAVVLPPRDLSEEVQHEVELTVVIGATTRDVAVEDALTRVFGYTIANDVSARDLQRRDAQVIRAKGFDTFCPVGPWIETELDPSDLAIRCAVNGQVRQDGTTADLIFDVPTLVSSISRWATLAPGDVILTGSPSGTGSLADGDGVELTIDGIGTLRHTVRATR